MRFVSPETVRIDLGAGDWIDIKRELSVGDEKKLLASGLRRASATSDAVDVDWAERAVARVEIYLTGWSALDDQRRPIPVTRSAIQALAVEDFNRIEAAITGHEHQMDEAKKVQSGTPTLTVA